jgi:hypothetical protein
MFRSKPIIHAYADSKPKNTVLQALSQATSHSPCNTVFVSMLTTTRRKTQWFIVRRRKWIYKNNGDLIARSSGRDNRNSSLLTKTKIVYRQWKTTQTAVPYLCGYTNMLDTRTTESVTNQFGILFTVGDFFFISL